MRVLDVEDLEEEEFQNVLKSLVPPIKERNLDYELKFRKYLYSFDFNTHKKICENINLKHNKVQK